jgi:hypothetical protein
MKKFNNFTANAFVKNAKKNVLGLTVMLGLTGMSTAVQAQNIFPASGNVGIGTTTPSYPLHIYNSAATINAQIDGTSTSWTGMYMRNSTATGIPYYAFTANGTTAWTQLTAAGKWSLHLNGERLSVLNTGFVGIGTTAPGFKLDVVGRIRLGSDGSGSGAWFRNTANTSDVGFVGMANDNHVGFWGNTGAGWALNVNTTNGNVGIGTLTTTTGYKLSVNGSIRAKELVVESGWADYVFAKNYKLRPLTEVESYIKTNNHLPDVPSATEVQANGVKLGEMQTTLLQKIEELTLYTIESNKQIIALQEKVNALQAELDKK